MLVRVYQNARSQIKKERWLGLTLNRVKRDQDGEDYLFEQDVN